MQHVYDELNKIESLQGKMVLHEKEEYISIDFHEYLHLEVGDDIVEVNRYLTHWHPDDDDDTIEAITKIAAGEWIFVERRSPLARFFAPAWGPLRIIDKKKYEKKKEKYTSRKSLRIYTGNAILKRNTWWW